MRWYEGKKLFITGGSSGIGRSMALMAAGWGADVAIAARGQQALDATLADLNAVRPGNHHAYSLDITDREAIRAVSAKVLDDLGGLDVLVNNAGISFPAEFMDISDEMLDRVMDINFMGTMNVTRAFHRHFIDQGYGQICNVSSVLGYMSVYGYTVYAASKHAQTAFSEALRQELLPSGVGVTVVYPPDTDTPQYHKEKETQPAVTAMINGHVKLLPPDFVAAESLKGIARNKNHVFPGFANKALYRVVSWIPGITALYLDWQIRGFLRKHGRGVVQT